MEDKNKKGIDGEEFVNNIAFKSLLKYWCYPSPKDENGDKKEICDLLVLFKDICIIFSVKNYTFDGNYERYFKNTIEKASKQIQGAERKLFNFGREVHLKHPEKELEVFNKNKYKKIYRIIVNLGENVELYSPEKETLKGQNITIFDKETFEIVLHELDTIADFTEYLNKRSEFIKSQKQMVWIGEEKNFLAYYLKNGCDFPQSPSANHDLIFFDFSDQWDEFSSEENQLKYTKKKEADKDSYFLDELCEREMVKMKNGDILAQEFLSFNRFYRRVFVKNFFDFYSKFSSNKNGITAKRYLELGEYGIVFFYYSKDLVQSPYIDNVFQTAVCGYHIYTNFAKKKMLGLATTKDMEQFKFFFADFSQNPLPFEEIETIKRNYQQLGWFSKLEEFKISEKEFPDAD